MICFHFLLLLGSRAHRVGSSLETQDNARQSQGCHGGQAYARHHRGGKEVDPSIPWSLVFPGKISDPTVTSASSVVCLRMQGTDCLLQEQPGKPQRPLLQHRQISAGSSTGGPAVRGLAEETGFV